MMSRLPLVTITCFLLSAVAEGAAVDSLVIHGLSERVQIHGSIHGRADVRLRSPYVAPPFDSLVPLSGLVYTVPVPHRTGVTARATFGGWRPVITTDASVTAEPRAQVRAVGSREWKPEALVYVWPWRVREGNIEIADTAVITVTWDGNPEPQAIPVATANREWINPSAPYVRLTTSRDGIGMIRASDVITTEPRFTDATISRLCLFWKGSPQPLLVVGKTNDDALSPSDTIVFMARRPQGDTSFLSMEDSVAVFFLTLRDVPDNPRFTLSDRVTSEVNLNSVKIRQRFEVDSGYYHLGSAPDNENGLYNTDLAFLEGYYWFFLNATDYTRSTWMFPLAPSQNGTVTVTTHWATLSDLPAYNPEHRLDGSLNGALPIQKTINGYGWHQLVHQANVTTVPAGLQSIKFYATGIDSLRKYRDYGSQIVIDAIEVEADVLPVLEQGMRTVHVPERSQPTNISWFNATSGDGWWMDTTLHRIGRMTAQRSASIVRGGIAPVEWNWPTIPDDPQTWRFTSMFGDANGNLDTMNAYAVAEWAPGSSTPATFTLASEAEVIERINKAPSRTHMVIAGVGRQQSGTLQAALSNKLLPTTSQPNWVVAGIIGVGGSANGNTMRSGCGSTYILDRNDAAGKAFDCHLPEGSALTMHVADSSGVQWATVMAARLQNLQADTSQADFIIITHATHREQAERLAAHRRLHNNLRVKVVDVDAILDEFGNGHHQPEALRSYLAWHYANASLPRLQSVLLFGNASWDMRLAVKGGNVGAKLADQVPTYGRPSSDYFFGLLDDPTDVVISEAVVGRIPAITAEDGRVMVDKIIFMDTLRYDNWMRRWYFVGGGKEEEGLCDIYRTLLEDPFNTGITFLDPPLCFDTATLCKSDAPPNAGYYITREINTGVQWMNYLGHGATEQFDITGWEPSELNNAGKYGIMATYACQTGSFSNPSVVCKNTQYLVAPDRGFVAAIGGTGWQTIWMADHLHFRLHEALRNGGRYLGDLLYSAKLGIADPQNKQSINTVMQFCLLGDPYSRVVMDNKPNIAIRRRDVDVLPQEGSAQITDADSIARIVVNVLNQGTGTTAPLLVKVRYTYAGVTDSIITEVPDGICQTATATIHLPIRNRAGEHTLVIAIDPANVLGDDPSDNTLTHTITVLPQSLLPLEPVAYEQLNTALVHVRQIDPLGTSPDRQVRFAISTRNTLQPEDVLVYSTDDEVTRDYSIVDWDADLRPFNVTGRLWLGSWTVDGDGASSAVLWVPFHVHQGHPARARYEAADLRSLSGGAVVYDSAEQAYRLANVGKSIFLRSSGIATSDGTSNPPLEMAVGSIMYVRNEFYRGINLIVLRQTDTVPRAIRRYDTWKEPAPIESGHNGFSSDLLRFLIDSVAADEYVLLAACNESFTGFERDSTMDSLIEVLHSYGSRFADSLAANSSWVMIGRKGLQPGQATERWKGAPDSMVTVTDTLQFYAPSGLLTSPTIGPARFWDALQFDHDSAGILATVYGRTVSGDEFLLGSVPPGQRLWNPNAPPGTSHLRIEWSLEQTASRQSSHVRGVRAHYIPAAEVVLEPQQFLLSGAEALRGDTISIQGVVRNADRRWPVYNVTIPIAHDSTSAAVVATFDTLDADASGTFAVKLSTAPWPSAGSVVALATVPENTPEFYRFNNRAASPLTITEDAIPPSLASYADQKVVVSGDYVQTHPLIEVRLFDNSKLPITDVTRLVVFMNGLRIREGVVENFEFLPTDSCRSISTDSTLRAIMRFRFPMEPGQNNLLVRAQDATGNSVEQETSLFLATENGISSVTPAPNPTTGPTTFYVYIRTPGSAADSRLRISDMQGRTVTILETTVPVAQGTLHWNGLSSEGASVAPGTYVWRLELPGADGTWSVGNTGVLQVLR